jgi:membrane-associated phospholipid phosphatase
MDFLTGYVVFHWVATWANPVCDIFFRAVTDLGYHTFYYLAIASLFWVVDRRCACILFLLVIASGYVNTFAKLWVHTPRPDPLLARVLDLRPYQSGSNAFPSGHAQNAVVFWGYLALWVGRRWFSVLAGVLMVLISLSRLYLAVHFPIDILGGLVLGALMMLFVRPPIERWAARDFRLRPAAMIVIVIASLALTFISADQTLALISGSLIGFLLGAVWLPQAPLVFSSVPRSVASTIIGVLLLLGLSITFDTLPHLPLILYVQVLVMWVIAVWLYPRTLLRLLARASDTP